MKGILVILDGLGDLPCRQLGDKTPLEAAETPNLDFFSARGEMGYMYSIKPGYAPESHEAILPIFQDDVSESRGQLEARGADIKLIRGDLALRANFATIDSLKEGNIIDRRVGRTLTTDEAMTLAKALNKIELPCKFIFVPTIQHRAVFVLKGGFSDNITGNDKTYSEIGIPVSGKVGAFKTLDEEENSSYTVNILNEFVEKAYNVLNSHPVNENRRQKGLLPANFLLMRGPGIEPPKLRFYRDWLSVCYMPLEIGFSKVSGMKVFSFQYPKLKSLDAYENLREGLKEACDFSIKVLKKNYKDSNYAYVHIKETDLPGHDNKPFEKKSMIEYIDKTLFKFLKDFAPQNRIKVVITGDHSTPCRLKSHSADPVPVLFYNNTKALPSEIKKTMLRFVPFLKKSAPKKSLTYSNASDTNTNIPKDKFKFCEKNARLGSLGRIEGKELLSKIGFDK